MDLTVTLNLAWVIVPLIVLAVALGLPLWMEVLRGWGREHGWHVPVLHVVGLLAISQVGGALGFLVREGVLDQVALAQLVVGTPVATITIIAWRAGMHRPTS